jgi:hypothetical protein
VRKIRKMRIIGVVYIRDEVVELGLSVVEQPSCALGSLTSRSRDERVVCAYLTRNSDQIGQVGLWASSEEHPSLVLSIPSPLWSPPLCLAQPCLPTSLPMDSLA